MNIELFFDFGSNYSYPAVMLAEQAARERGITLSLRPILLGPIFAAQGYTEPPFVQYSTKGRYAFRDLERVCAELGLPWKKPSQFPRRGVLPTRIALLGVDAGWGGAFARRVFSLNFAEDREIDDEPTMRAVLAEILPHGVDVEDVLTRAVSPDNRERLRREVERAQSLGVFGAPTFVVGEELFWGHDRMRQALDWAERHAAR